MRIGLLPDSLCHRKPGTEVQINLKTTKEAIYDGIVNICLVGIHHMYTFYTDNLVYFLHAILERLLWECYMLLLVRLLKMQATIKSNQIMKAM